MSTIEWKLGIYLLLVALLLMTIASALAFVSGQRIDVNLFTDREGQTITTAGFLWILLYPFVIVWLLGDIPQVKRTETP
jgi:hypothetical protein